MLVVMRRLLVLLFLAATACPDLASAPIPTECTKLFDKCKLPAGPLGVCQEIDCAEGKTAPCLKCVSQH